MRKVFEHASYITVNISSPNTPGLRDLQYGEALDDLLQSLKNEQLDLAAKHNKQVPMRLRSLQILMKYKLRKLVSH